MMKITTTVAVLLCAGALLSACEEKVNDTKKPTFIEPLPPTTEGVLAEQNVPYKLQFGYFDDVLLASIQIQVEGQPPINEVINKKNGTYSKELLFAQTGDYAVTIKLIDGVGNSELYSNTFKVGAQGMNWIPNGDLVADDDWLTFPNWTMVPAAKGDNGWMITEKGNFTELFPTYIAFFASSGDPLWQPINYTGALSQEIMSLPNGKYELSIRYSSGRNEEGFGAYDPATVQLKAQGFGATDLVVNMNATEVTASGANVWAELRREIEVTQGQCKVGVYLNATTTAGLGNWANVDWFKLIRKPQ